MPNGYIDLPLSTRLLGQQVEYSQDFGFFLTFS